ncbi:FKBP-type peptidyl-prolyl cis-trans isomerase [Sphingobacterium thalpophilum]|uniref:peptidylprolyl isomerase n=1 Tax=Sphingobacterium thalpophilum TaxID=259 RepID=A0A4U9V3R4_9SPHI|nr:FKBP-type peptidyl-prolyl cis-trans isomerase [Sphingobacterium thalpophilum]VTR39452.1 FKBP-type peptidyl-prolyl cis-trans isomerase [Sphingobacterium thalpophilum]
MKNITKFLMAFLCLGMIFASCSKGDDINWDELEEKARQEQIRRYKTKKEQALQIKTYAEAEFTNPKFSSDSTGIWYEVINEGTGDAYDYTIPAKVSVNYKGELMNETVFAATKEGTPANYANLGYTFNETTQGQFLGSCWYFAFLPASVNKNGIEQKIYGLLEKGLKKGSKIRFITPSIWGFDNREYKIGDGPTIPANSPLIYTIEVVSIEKATN